MLMDFDRALWLVTPNIEIACGLLEIGVGRIVFEALRVGRVRAFVLLLITVEVGDLRTRTGCLVRRTRGCALFSNREPDRFGFVASIELEKIAAAATGPESTG